MASSGRTGYGPVQRAVAWIGVAVIAVCIIWSEIAPRGERLPQRDARPLAAEGPIKRVIIDAGHGGEDSGAIRNGVMEKDLTLDVALRVERLVRTKGLATVLTRDVDKSISLVNRAAVANRERDSIFVSIHFDEGGRAAATGVQTFYAVRQVPAAAGLASWLPFLQRVSAAPDNVESQSLAAFVQGALVSGTRAFDRGTRAEQFYVVANVQHPAVLVEGGFLSNNDDIAKLTTESYRQQLAEAITEGILRYREAAGQREPSTLAVAKPGT
jgi:N-acetylmuramoyl-L-alanine amidase